jgi:hypothetical protein
MAIRRQHRRISPRFADWVKFSLFVFWELDLTANFKRSGQADQNGGIRIPRLWRRSILPCERAVDENDIARDRRMVARNDCFAILSNKVIGVASHERMRRSLKRSATFQFPRGAGSANDEHGKDCQSKQVFRFHRLLWFECCDA